MHSCSHTLFQTLHCDWSCTVQCSTTNCYNGSYQTPPLFCGKGVWPCETMHKHVYLERGESGCWLGSHTHTFTCIQLWKCPCATQWSNVSSQNTSSFLHTTFDFEPIFNACATITTTFCMHNCHGFLEEWQLSWTCTKGNQRWLCWY